MCSETLRVKAGTPSVSASPRCQHRSRMLLASHALLPQACEPTLNACASAQVKPTVLIGLAGAGKLFTEEILVAMGEHNERPIIM